MDDKARSGAEIFSLLRASTLSPGDYLDTYFMTGAERTTDM